MGETPFLRPLEKVDAEEEWRRREKI